MARSLAVGGQLLGLRGLGGEYDDVFLPLIGAHQAHNAVCALAAVEAFLGGGLDARGPLDPQIVVAGLGKATSPGRLEVVRTSPTVVLDAAHNPAGARATAAAITEGFAFGRLVGVFAAMGDKDARGMLEALEPVLAEVVVTQSSSRGRCRPTSWRPWRSRSSVRTGSRSAPVSTTRSTRRSPWPRRRATTSPGRACW
jgi:dihydrofolate synthase/folylpolyglutamate synthase